MDDERYRRGLESAYRIAGRQRTDDFLSTLAEVSPALGEHIIGFIYGELYSRPGLGRRERALVTLAVLAAMGGCERELTLHIGLALDADPGVEPAAIIEVFSLVGAYAGTPRALNAVYTAKELFARRGLLPLG